MIFPFPHVHSGGSMKKWREKKRNKFRKSGKQFDRLTIWAFKSSTIAYLLTHSMNSNIYFSVVVFSSSFPFAGSSLYVLRSVVILLISDCMFEMVLGAGPWCCINTIKSINSWKRWNFRDNFRMFIVFRLEFLNQHRRKINKIELKEDTYHGCIEHLNIQH